jgi:hypothetical protein
MPRGGWPVASGRPADERVHTGCDGANARRPFVHIPLRSFVDCAGRLTHAQPDRPTPQGLIPTWLLLGPRRLLRAGLFLPPSPIHANSAAHFSCGDRRDDPQQPKARATAP